MRYDINFIADKLSIPYRTQGNDDLTFEHFDAVFVARKDSLVWVSSRLDNHGEILNVCQAKIIICDEGIKADAYCRPHQTFIQTERPQVLFMRIVKLLCGHQSRSNGGIHPTAIVSADASIGANVSIGPFAIIGACVIGDNSAVDSHSTIHDNVVIGRWVNISSYCNIGAEGFGHIENEHGSLENMLHIGKVIIEDNVEIFPYTNVDRGTLSETRIGKETVVDRFCHIAHNSVIGRRTIITANVTLCGSCRVGNNCFIGVGSAIKDKVAVGDNSVIGIGSVVTKNVPPNEIWFGNPAKCHKSI